MNFGLVLMILNAITYFLSRSNVETKPNYLIGYRTKRSRSSLQNWTLAQNIFFSLSILFLLIVILLNKLALINNHYYLITCLIAYLLAAGITEYLLAKNKR